jgi:hypothetical protein
MSRFRIRSEFILVYGTVSGSRKAKMALEKQNKNVAISCFDLLDVLSEAVLRIRITLMRIRILLVSMMRVHPACHFYADPDPSFQIQAQNL